MERKKKKEQRKMRQIKALHAKQVLEAELEAKQAETQGSTYCVYLAIAICMC